MSDPRRTYAWQKLARQVVKDQPTCQVRSPRCTRVSTEADHIKPVSTHPHLAMDRANLRGSCGPCNKWRRWHETEPRSPSPALDIFD